MELSIFNLFLVLLAAWLGGNLATRLAYPSVLGEIVAGILLGPPLLGLLHGSEALTVLAELGVLLMMLYIGMEIDPRELGKASKGGVLAALGGFILPFGLGVWAVTAFGGTAIAGVFVGTAMGVTSLATKSRILFDLQILDTRIAHVMMTGALVTDTLSLIIFAGIISFITAGSLDVVGVGFIVLKVVLFFTASWVLGFQVFPILYRWLKRLELTGRTFNATLILLITLAFAELAHLAGLHGILGAFIAGLFLREALAGRKLSHELTELVKDVSLGFLAPLFFVTAGFQVSFSVFQTSLPLLLTVVVLATLGKIVGSALFYLPSGHGWREGITIGLGMNDRGAVEIVIAGIGLQAGVISQEIFSILVFMAILTTATVPVLLKWGVAWLERRGELVRSSTKEGIIIAGAGPVARLLGQELAASQSVTFIDSNDENCRAVRALGLNAIHGDALNDGILTEAGIQNVGTFIGLTPNAEINVLAAQRARTSYFVPKLRVFLGKESDGGLHTISETLGAQLLFTHPVDLLEWDHKLESLEVDKLVHAVETGNPAVLRERLGETSFLPLLIKRSGVTQLFSSFQELKPGDELMALAPPGSYAN